MSLMSRSSSVLRAHLRPVMPTRKYSLRVRKPPKYPFEDKKFKSLEDSLACKGFLRPLKPYQPPENAEEKVIDICSKFNLSNERDKVIEDSVTRFNVLKECFTQFQHGIPNSQLCYIETIKDIVDFYKTPVDTTTPYDAMKNADLPKNLHVQYEYHRFHPDTDTFFGGVSAFPKSSTLVSGLRYQKKYAGYTAKNSIIRE